MPNHSASGRPQLVLPPRPREPKEPTEESKPGATDLRKRLRQNDHGEEGGSPVAERGRGRGAGGSGRGRGGGGAAKPADLRSKLAKR